MCLIQLLEDEQIALARYAAATNPSAIDRYGRLIEAIGRAARLARGEPGEEDPSAATPKAR